MTEIEALGVIGTLATAVATIVLVYLLWRTIKQVEATVKLSKVQTEFRFRPWIGPVNKIQLLDMLNTNESQTPSHPTWPCLSCGVDCHAYSHHRKSGIPIFQECT